MFLFHFHFRLFLFYLRLSHNETRYRSLRYLVLITFRCINDFLNISFLYNSVEKFLTDVFLGVRWPRRRGLGLGTIISEDAIAVLWDPGLPRPFTIKLSEFPSLKYQLIKRVESLVESLTSYRTRRLHPDTRTTRRTRQLQHPELLLQLTDFFRPCKIPIFNKGRDSNQ